MVITEANIWEWLEEVSDPEVPVLSVLDLGVVRGVLIDGNTVTVQLTPTYSGCPAMDTIADDIKSMLQSKGVDKVITTMQLSPAWSSDWISKNGKIKLEAYGIAPPVDSTHDVHALFGKEVTVPCPRCKSRNTKLSSQFGSTACKALYQCLDCKEPFDYFKCLK